MTKEMPVKTWKEVSREYPDYLKNAKIKNPKPRLLALLNIEKFLQEHNPGLLLGNIQLSQIDKIKLKNSYRDWKGENLSGSEYQVFNHFFNAC